jgi:hypothetical protein
MTERYWSPFQYLAFDNTSQAILAHGGTAADALYAADQIAPDAPIYVLDAGRLGWKLWDLRMNLYSAKEALRRGEGEEIISCLSASGGCAGGSKQLRVKR